MRCFFTAMQWAGGYFLQSCTCPLNGRKIACKNSCFSLLFAAGVVSHGGTSATQWQKFYTDDGNQCLHNKSCSHGVPIAKLFNCTFLLANFGKVLC